MTNSHALIPHQPSAPSLLAQAFSESDSRVETTRTLASIATKATAAGGGGMARSMFASSSDTSNNPFGGVDQSSQATKQYSAYKGHPHAAIRPIAAKIADQNIMVGRKKPGGDKKNSSGGSGGGAGKKQLEWAATLAYKTAPPSVRKAISEGLEIIDDHPVVEIIEEPNPWMTKWALMYCTVVSIKVTGRCVWWMVERDDWESNASTPAAGLKPGRPQQQHRTLDLYYFPSHWATPIGKEGDPFAEWKIQIPGSTDPFYVPDSDIVYFANPDPANPLSSYSDIQAQSRAINTDDQIQQAQFASMANGVNPGIVLTAGRLPGVGPGGQVRDGAGPRPTLNAEQRKQIMEAIKLAYRGAQKFGEPIIIDGLIESVTPYTLSPADLAFPEGSKLTKDRIFQGIGTNPIIAGEVEGANRASAYVAEENFYANVVNPLITLISEVMTKKLAPRINALTSSVNRIASKGRFHRRQPDKLYIWLEAAKAHDVEMELAQMEFLAANQWLKGNEAREKLGLPPDPTLDKFPDPPKLPMGGPAGGAGTTGSARIQKPGRGGAGVAGSGGQSRNGSRNGGR